MNQTDSFANNPSKQPLIIDEMAALRQHLQGHPQREEILRNVREYSRSDCEAGTG